MTVFQALLLAVASSIYGLPFWRGGFIDQFTGKPLIVALIIGIVMGNIKQAMIIGSVLQAMYIGVIAVGGIQSMPSITRCIWFALPLAIISGADAEFAVTLCVPFSMLETFITQFLRTLNTYFLHSADRKIDEGKFDKAYITYYYGLILSTAVNFIIIFGMNVLGSTVILQYAELIPAWLLGSMKIFTKMGAVLGFGMLLTGLIKKNIQFLYFVFGFVLFKVMGLDTITVPIIAGVLAYLLFICTGTKKEAEHV